MGEARTVLPLPFLLSRVRTKSATMNETKTKQKKSDAIKRADNQHSETSATRTKGEDTQKKKAEESGERAHNLQKEKSSKAHTEGVSWGVSVAVCLCRTDKKKKKAPEIQRQCSKSSRKTSR